MKDSPLLLLAVSVFCSGGTYTRNMTSSVRLISITFCFGERHLGSLLPLRNLMPPTISCNFSNIEFKEKSLCLYVHTSNLLVWKGPRLEFSSLIILLKAETVMSGCTTKSVRLLKLSLPLWPTRRYQIVFFNVSAGFLARFPLGG